jgi:hypothetical protein
MSDKREELIALIHQTADEVSEVANSTPYGVKIKAESLLSVCELLYKNPTAYFDMLSCVTELIMVLMQVRWKSFIICIPFR